MAKDSKDTRQRLIAAADKLFYSEGIRAVGVDAVALAASVTKRTLYYHFPSKEDLIAAYLDERDQKTLGSYQSVVSDPDASAARQIRGIFERLEQNAQNPDWRGCSFVRAAGEFAALPGHPARVIASRHKKRFEDWLVQLLLAEGVADAGSLARQIMVLFDGAVTQILIHRDPGYAGSAAQAALLLLKSHGIEDVAPRSA
ncbi:TetR/AcrR family transcriptional regulator [Aestuariivirga sp.]|uniref:TetR/AcrR family transcriptional regulator n=1 Tax=Aestuariivirga sp. TaxID=2650926 RepID=UPI0039E39992